MKSGLTRDILGLTGVLMLGVGVALRWEYPMALVVVGTILIVVAMISAWRSAE